MNKFSQYMDLVERCFVERVPNIIPLTEDVFAKYPTRVYYHCEGEKVIGGVMVVELSDLVHGISNMVVEPERRREYIGSKLMDEVHDDVSGIILLKTRQAAKFYKKLGYKNFHKGMMIRADGYGVDF